MTNTAGKLKNRVAIITGAGKSGARWGTGTATALLFAREGARIAIVDINEENARATKQLLEHEGYDSETFIADVSESRHVETMAGKVIKRFGGVDILVNNHGVYLDGDGSPLDLDETIWERTFAINTRGCYLTAKAVLPHMIRNKRGVIVHYSSVQAIRDSHDAGGAAYCASKAAIHALSRQIAMHHGDDGIRSNVIVVGMIESNMVARDYETKEEAEDAFNERDRHVILNRRGDPWDIAKAALYLSSDESAFVTAAEIVVDGGTMSRAT